MSGPNVVDKAKMVFHYVAKMAPRAANSADCQDANREMKVCFRHSKHSIKCDANAPCLECDAGLKLYSYDQCRRHLDVVRSEKRFESIEVDRSENMIEKLAEMDENGRKTAQLVDTLVAKHDLILAALDRRQDSAETANCALKEMSRNGLKSQKGVEALCERLAECHALLQSVTSQDTSARLAAIEGHVADAANETRAWRAGWEAAAERARERDDALLAEWRDGKTALAAIERQLEAVRADLKGECERARQHLAESVVGLRAELSAAMAGVREEIGAVGNSTHVLATDLKDSLPERLMDAFGGILMLSADTSRRMDGQTNDM